MFVTHSAQSKSESVNRWRTGIAFNGKLQQHNLDGHLENEDRLLAINENLEKHGLLKKCLKVKERTASIEELQLVHDTPYIERILSTQKVSTSERKRMEKQYTDVYFCEGTFNAAITAVGSLLQTVDEVVTGNCNNGFAIIRPPGHHAEKDEACGFCIFNSVAIAARYAIQTYSTFEKAIKKVLIVDWDIHHGNGTQNIFYDEENVLYISLHRYDNGNFFPFNKTNGSHLACGEGKGAGYNINIPWNGPATDGDYLEAIYKVILPVAYEFSPDLVLVSSGFDAAVNDPLGGCFVSQPFFGHMTQILSGLAEGKVILALEGGYNLSSISVAACHCIGALLKESYLYKEDLYPSKSAKSSITDVIHVHKKYWASLNELPPPTLDYYGK